MRPIVKKFETPILDIAQHFFTFSGLSLLKHNILSNSLTNCIHHEASEGIVLFFWRKFSMLENSQFLCAESAIYMYQERV